MFKVPLLEHLDQSSRTISYVIELCVCALLEKGMHEEGLLRVGCGEFVHRLLFLYCGQRLLCVAYGHTDWMDGWVGG